MKKLQLLCAAGILVFTAAKTNAQNWTTTGNAGTNSSVNFIGTTDNRSFVIRSNNMKRVVIDSTGKVGIGTTSPSAKLHVVGDKFILSATSTTASSLIKLKRDLQIQDGGTTFATFDAVNHRLGIGTTTPTTSLDVNGVITATGGNSTNWNTSYGWGNHATAGYLTSETDPQVGSNTTSRVPRWNGSALITGVIYDNGTNIGIGTTTVTSKVNITGTSTSSSIPNVDVNTSAAATNSDVRGIRSSCVMNPGWGYGLEATGGFIGVYGVSDATTYSGGGFGVYGIASGSAGSRYGVYGTASNSGGDAWAGYFAGNTYASNMVIGYNTPSAGFLLTVGGKIICTEIRVQLTPFPDYVFDKDYKLRTIEEVESEINKNKRLPGMPSACEVEDSGMEVGKMQGKIVEKVEEQTLYIIQLNNKIKELEKKIEALASEQ